MDFGKTENAYRDIPMSEDVYRLFQMQREYQKNMRIRNDIKIEQYDNAGNVVAKYSKFIFTTKLGKSFTHEGLVCSLTRIIKNITQGKWKKQAGKEENPAFCRRRSHHICSGIHFAQGWLKIKFRMRA